MSVRSTKSLVVLSSLALVTGLIVWSQHQTVRAETVQSTTQDGPALGDTIDLLSWRDRKGRTLVEVNGKRSLALVAFVTPNCDSCAKTKDAMQTLRERAAKANIAYYVLMVPNDTNAQQYFSYADSLKIDAESFVWSNADVKAPASLTTMPAPYHLLLTNEGLVVNKWTGVPSSVSTQ
jgi:glutaredoxin